ncbi:MAG TPA: DJ-1/PfpI family protein [Bacteroidales bacterium]|jgi:4-methyl-5(b-hydroxyethyl)-thiazole monophosphate biosynthesis|nr:MAG: Chaperone protein YajL [Bacteroidetes bacterium ADurb.Bin090]HOD27549.1 DJ-1/PfpI family protein [Bacteroidales bacterium]HOH25225.1 DJ-1/PfpI family protein [Bacteroidales bacterium]HQM94014.1 DJ-1/PfpI family protein [Bacteroidales bacterium]HQP23486.1 DJ-1/PfpI family protein [Bacteroidales bacterium]
MKLLLFLAPGFEEIEAITVLDIARRAGLSIRSVSISNEKAVSGAHQISLNADLTFDEVNFDEAEALILPGGMPGTNNLNAHAGLKKQLVNFARNPDKTIAAICAAPLILGDLGLLDGKKATCYPGYESHLSRAKLSRKPVVRDGNIITADGPAHAMLFAIKLVDYLGNTFLADDITKGLNY